tara:strand:- start:826 stop:1776 length:951 start_codon:yes stop_codon:yes gene_type:complete
MKNRKAFIVGIKSTNLNKNEIYFLKKNKPWGVIIFSRNIRNLKQTKKLISEIKSCFNDKFYPIIIDEEGGKVSRLSKILDFSLFSSKYFGDLYKKNHKHFLYQYKVYVNNVSQILNYLNININTVPVLDVIRKRTNPVIGNRSFSKDPKIVSKVGDYCIDFYKQNKIATVVKHIPGHGLSNKDTHYDTPTIDENKKILNRIDFHPFKNKDTMFAMTAHIIYKKYDPNNTATHSKIIINEVIRNKMKFKNLIMSDDISMKSLKFNLENNALKAFEAGCNLVLHCNGKIEEMYPLAKYVPKIDDFTLKKTSQFYRFLM